MLETGGFAGRLASCEEWKLERRVYTADESGFGLLFWRVLEERFGLCLRGMVEVER